MEIKEELVLKSIKDKKISELNNKEIQMIEDYLNEIYPIATVNHSFIMGYVVAIKRMFELVGEGVV